MFRIPIGRELLKKYEDNERVIVYIKGRLHSKSYKSLFPKDEMCLQIPYPYVSMKNILKDIQMWMRSLKTIWTDFKNIELKWRDKISIFMSKEGGAPSMKDISLFKDGDKVVHGAEMKFIRFEVVCHSEEAYTKTSKNFERKMMGMMEMRNKKRESEHSVREPNLQENTNEQESGVQSNNLHELQDISVSNIEQPIVPNPFYKEGNLKSSEVPINELKKKRSTGAGRRRRKKTKISTDNQNL